MKALAVVFILSVLAFAGTSERMQGEVRKTDNDGTVIIVTIDLDDGPYSGKVLTLSCMIGVPACENIKSAEDVIVETDGPLYTRHGHFRNDAEAVVQLKRDSAKRIRFYVASVEPAKKDDKQNCPDK